MGTSTQVTRDGSTVQGALMNRCESEPGRWMLGESPGTCFHTPKEALPDPPGAVQVTWGALMVHVGGGWVALDEFLVKNDPG